MVVYMVSANSMNRYAGIAHSKKKVQLNSVPQTLPNRYSKPDMVAVRVGLFTLTACRCGAILLATKSKCFPGMPYHSIWFSCMTLS
jgi:hypothetical protein